MRLSDQPEYLNAVLASVDGHFSTARENFEVLIARAEIEEDLPTLSFLLQLLGNVEAKAGDPELGHQYHKRALTLGMDIPFIYLQYAKGLLNSFGRDDLATLQLTAAEDFLNSTRWLAGEDDLPREWYEQEIANVRAEIRSRQP